jgi:hypothetical protein
VKFKYLIALLLFLTACNKLLDDSISAEEHLITGKWKQTEAYIISGGPQYWVNIENGEEIEFFENGTFSSTRFAECVSGTFSIKENELLLKYNCRGFKPDAENDEGFITYKLKLLPDYFILTPTSGALCIEGCSVKYHNIY